jgi:tetratricopeptide (TPR) repeat protein
VAGGIEEGDRKATTLAGIACKCALAGEKDKASELFAEALDIARKLGRREGKAWALSRISRAHAEAGEPDKALRVSKMIWLDPYWKATALADVAAAYEKAGQPEKASETLADALRSTQSVRDAKLRADVIVDVAEALGKAGQKEKACEVLTLALEAGENIKEDSTDRAFVRAQVAIRCSEMGEFDQAFEIAKAISGEYHGRWALSELAAKLAGSSKFAEALHIAKSIQALEDKATALGDVGVAHVKAGRAMTDEERQILHQIVMELERPGAADAVRAK